jgi:L-rhamnose isomerase
MKKEFIKQSYQLAKEQYAELGVDTNKVLSEMDNINISLHCWQTDDVGGFEKAGAVVVFKQRGIFPVRQPLSNR